MSVLLFQAKPDAADAVVEVHIGAANQATLDAVCRAVGVQVIGPNGDYVWGQGITCPSGAYQAVIQNSVIDENFVETSPAVLGSGVRYTLAVTDAWIGRLIADGEIAESMSRQALLGYWATVGTAVTRDGWPAHELNGVWIWQSVPPGAVRIAGAT